MMKEEKEGGPCGSFKLFPLVLSPGCARTVGCDGVGECDRGFLLLLLPNCLASLV